MSNEKEVLSMDEKVAIVHDLQQKMIADIMAKSVKTETSIDGQKSLAAEAQTKVN